MSRVKVLVLTGFGLNCDVETAHAFELAGASAERVHINSVIDRSVGLDGFQIIVFIGGFSWGDDHGAGVIQAVRLRTTLGAELRRFVDQGNLVLGICNGFQTLANLGLLPGFDSETSSRSVALIANRCGNFRNQWVRLQVNPESRCVFTRNIREAELPVRHGEGQFYAEPATLRRLEQGAQIALRYALPDGKPAGGNFPHNPNGSVDDVAGICDASGRVFGLMPHPEAFNDWTNHPNWPRLRETAKRSGKPFNTGLPVGIQILKNGVDYLR
jgi:phosphoribosylformylglycinamidine synthase